jgi:CP family cyanate transporter-like MFS transporter
MPLEGASDGLWADEPAVKGASDEDGRPDRLRRAIVLVAIVLLAANLRPAITSVAPLIGRIQADAGVSSGAAGLLTALPLLAFAALSPAAPRLARRFGAERVLIGSMLALCGGILLRSSGTTAATLFAGTAVLGAAIAAGNVLLPGLVKERFSGRIGAATGAYTVAMGTSAAIAAGASVPLTRLLGPGWQAPLALWAAPALLAAVAWAPLLGRGNRDPKPPRQARASPAANLWRSALAWQVTAFMGLQSLGYYATLTWLPEILREGGTGAEDGGLAARALPGRGDRLDVRSTSGGRQEALAAGRRRGLGRPLRCRRPGAAPLRRRRRGPLGHAAGARAGGLLQPGADALRAAGRGPRAGRRALGHGPVVRLPARGARAARLRRLRDATGSWTLPLALLLGITACLLAAGLGAGRDARVGAPAGDGEEPRMSRGLGDLQRRVCEVLYVDGDGELPLRELRRRLGDPDRSNLRRAIRGLLERGMVEEQSGPGGEQRVALEVWTYIAMGGDRPAFLAVRPDPTHGGAGRPGGAAEDAPEPVRRRPLPGEPGRPGGSATSIASSATGPWARRRGRSSVRCTGTPDPRKKACR